MAAPAYLAVRGHAQTIAALSRHNCIGYRLLASGPLYEWDLRDGQRTESARVGGTSVMTDATFARDFALAGMD